MKLTTILAQAGTRSDARTGAVSTPIYQTATFGHPGLGCSTGFDYSRMANPTRSVLESTLARIDGGTHGFAFSSGLAAIDTLFHLFNPGDQIIVTEDLYGGTYRLFEKVLKPRGISAIFVDTSSIEAVKAAAHPSVKGLFVESLSNPLLRLADISALSRLAKEQGWLFFVDNTFLTPVCVRPLELGADVTIYSATKYLCGHNDVLAGAIVTGVPAIAERIAFFQNAIGAVLGPFDSWLLLRGLKTLALRLRVQEDNARRIALWLFQQPFIRKVYYPGLQNHCGCAKEDISFSGTGAMIAFEVADKNLIKQILDRVKVFIFAESLGGVESLITYPLAQTHADIEPAVRERLGISEYLLRLSIGIEDADDLISDLQQAAKGAE